MFADVLLPARIRTRIMDGNPNHLRLVRHTDSVVDLLLVCFVNYDAQTMIRIAFLLEVLLFENSSFQDPLLKS